MNDPPIPSPANQLSRPGNDGERSQVATVFVSYSHHDRDWVQKLQLHLKSLEEPHRVVVWNDSKIAPGDRWSNDIDEAIRGARLAILLISPDFLASDFITKREIPLLLEAAHTRNLRLISVLVRPSRYWTQVELSQFQAINTEATVLSGLSAHDQDRIWVNLTEAVARELRSFPERSSQAKADPPVDAVHLKPMTAPWTATLPAFDSAVWRLPQLSEHANHPTLHYMPSKYDLIEPLSHFPNLESPSIPFVQGPAKSDLFPGFRQVTVFGLLVVGCNKVVDALKSQWEWIKKVFDFDIETLKQIVIGFLLLFWGLLPIMVVINAIEKPWGRTYPRWIRFYFILFGLALIAGSSVFTAKVHEKLRTDESAKVFLEQLDNREHAAFGYLESVWMHTLDVRKTDQQDALAALEAAMPSELRQKLGNNLALYAGAKVSTFNHDDHVIWFVLCLVGIIVGAINLFCGLILRSIWR